MYPLRAGQLRAVLYESCRGMEGCTTLCLGLDTFFEFKIAPPRIDLSRLETFLREKEGFFFAKRHMEEKFAQEARLSAINWLTISFIRSIDYLRVHLTGEQSMLRQILRKVSTSQHGAIEWIGEKVGC